MSFPLESIPEDEILLTKALMDRVKSKSKRSLSSIWKCSHSDCIAYPYSKSAIFCRVVQRPLWTLILILYALTFTYLDHS